MKTPLRVLIVEDREDDAELLLHELRRGGYDPSAVRVETALAMGAALDRQSWEVVISDYALSQFSGLAALELLQERQLDVPFIIVSGAISADTAVAAMKAGAHDYVVKGKLARLIPAIERGLGEARERQARRQAEQVLQVSERRFRSLIENISGIIAVLAPDGTILYQSPSVEPTLGYSPEELIGTNLVTYLHPEDSANLAAFLEELLRQPGVLQPGEFRIQHRDGSWRVLGAMARSLLHDPGVQGIIVNARDITDRKQLEEQLRQSQKMDAIGRLAGGVAHDFNNMLGAIIGYADLLLHRIGDDEAARECLQEISKAGERAAALTRQLLMFSRKQVLAPQLLDLNEIAGNIHKMLDRLIGEDIELQIVADPAAARVKADPGQIEQVLLNLAINSRDAMPQGGRLTIETKNVNPTETAGRQLASVHPGPYVALAVSDTGCGMDEATKSHIFEPFFTTKEQGKGTGLGLATVYGIVQQSGGWIEVDSQPGQGTTFKVYLPGTVDEAQADVAPADLAGPPCGSGTILVVEDEEIVRGLVQKVLRMQGYRVLAAERGDEALRICQEQEQEIDLLLTDVVMPGMSGRELAEQAAVMRPEMKVLFMSGYTDDAVVRHRVFDTEIAFIQKPFTPAALASKVQDVLGAS
jgi:two-component system cell cycle sensor histidine kinase/response regulator CckA